MTRHGESAEAVQESDRENIRRGDTFDTPEGPIAVVGIQTDGDLQVTDPTVDHEQDARYGTWVLNRAEFEEALDDGAISPGGA